MADVTSKLDNSLPVFDSDVWHVQKVIDVASGDANSGDFIQAIVLPQGHKGRIVNAVLRTSATLGASCTVQAKVDHAGTKTSLTAASTAGAASKSDASAQSGVPFDSVGGDTIGLVVAGANIGASATVTLDIFLTSARD